MSASGTFFPNQPYQEFLNAINNRDLKKAKESLNKIPNEKRKELLNGEFLKSGYSILGYIVTNLPDDENTKAIIKLLMDEGANPATRDPFLNTGSFCNTALLDAIAAEKWGLISFLIEQYDPKKHEDYINMASLQKTAKNTPLIFALKKQITPIEIIEALLKKGANPNTQNHHGETALHYAAEYANDQLLKLLLQYKAALDIKNTNNVIPFNLYAYQMGRYPVIEKDIVIKEKDGIPILIYQKTPTSPLASRYFSGIIDQTKMIGDKSFNIVCEVNDKYPTISFMVERVMPFDRKAKGYPQQLNDAMLQNLMPSNYDDKKFIEDLNQFHHKYQEQDVLIKQGKYYLVSQNDDINKLLNYLNEHIIKSKSPVLDEVLELRIAIASAKSISEVDAVINEYRDLGLKEECDELAKICHSIANTQPSSPRRTP